MKNPSLDDTPDPDGEAVGPSPAGTGDNVGRVFDSAAPEPTLVEAEHNSSDSADAAPAAGPPAGSPRDLHQQEPEITDAPSAGEAAVVAKPSPAQHDDSGSDRPESRATTFTPVRSRKPPKRPRVQTAAARRAMARGMTTVREAPKPSDGDRGTVGAAGAEATATMATQPAPGTDAGPSGHTPTQEPDDAHNNAEAATPGDTSEEVNDLGTDPSANEPPSTALDLDVYREEVVSLEQQVRDAQAEVRFWRNGTLLALALAASASLVLFWPF